MSQEIAALHTTISVRTQGVEQAAVSMKRLADAQSAMEKASASSSAKVQEMGQRLGELIAKEQQLLQVQQQGLAVLASQGRGYSDLAASVQKLGTAAAQAEQKLASLEQERADIEKMDVGGMGSAERTATFRRYQELEQIIPTLKTNIVDLNQAWRTESILLNQVGGRDLVKVRAGMESLTDGINGAGKAAGLNRTTFSSLFTTLMSGNISANLLSQSLFALAGGAAAVVAVVGVVVIAIQKLISVVTSSYKQLTQMADAMLMVDESTRRMAGSLRELQGINLAETATQLDKIASRVESFGGNRNIADNILKIGNALALASGDPRRTTEFANAFARAMETLNAEGLRDAGVNVSELERQMQSLAGTTEEYRRAAFVAFIQNDLAGRMGEIEDAADRFAMSFSQLGQRVKEGWDDLMANQAVQQMFADLGRQLHALAAALAPLVTGFGVFLVAGIKAAGMALEGFVISLRFIIDMVAKAERFLGFDKAAKGMEGFVKEIDDARAGAHDFEASLSLTQDELANYSNNIEAATQATQNLRKTWEERAQGGTGIIDSIRQMGSAWDVLQDNVTGSTVFDYFNSIDQVLGQLAEHGSSSLVALKEKADALFRAGIIDETVYNKMIEGFGVVQRASGPLLEAVRQIEEKYGENKSASEQAAGALNTQLAPGISNVGSVADAVAGQVAGLTGQIQTLQGVAAAGVSFGIGGMPQVLRLPGGFQQSVAGPAPGHPGGGGGRRPTGTVNRNIMRGERNVGDTSWKGQFDPREAADFFRPPKAPGGGGGGGGNRLAGIEDIRELFRQINQAILQGIRGGVMFSAAGNSIPAGGINEFLNTKGGTLIQTVNIRGIWDFADPGAKRQIIREMEEAIRNLKRET